MALITRRTRRDERESRRRRQRVEQQARVEHQGRLRRIDAIAWQLYKEVATYKQLKATEKSELAVFARLSDQERKKYLKSLSEAEFAALKQRAADGSWHKPDPQLIAAGMQLDATARRLVALKHGVAYKPSSPPS